MRTCLINLVIILFAVTVFSCSEKDLTNDPAIYYKSVKDSYDNKDYEIAIRQLGEFRSRYPYSKFAVEAELLIANSQFSLGRFDESAVAYATFVKLHPKHSEVPYALFKVGDSYWAMSPKEIDREQIYTVKAIHEWRKLVNQFPDNEYSKKANERIIEGTRRVAESEEFAAKFYCRKNIYHACAYRSIELADKYPDFKDMQKDALTRSVSAMGELIKQKEKEPESDKNLYFNSMSLAEMKDLLKELQNRLSKLK